MTLSVISSSTLLGSTPGCSFNNRVCIYDSKQLDIGSPLSIEAYEKAQHGIVSSAGDDALLFDREISAAGIKRNIVAGVSRHASIAPLLLSIPAIATLAEATAQYIAPLYGLTVAAAPLELPMEQISMLYRRTDQMNSRSDWFRKILK